MNLTITGHHLEVTPALQEYVTSKLERVTRHFDQVVDVRVSLSILNDKDKDRRQHAQCTVNVKGNVLHVEASAQDMYAAIDELVDKLDRQVGRYKDKTQSHHQTDAPRRAGAPV